MKALSNAHAILSPSSAHKWLTCAPSARFEEQISEETSDYADEGDIAHKVADLILSARAGIYVGTDWDYHLSALADSEYYTDDMVDHAEDYAEFVRGFGGTILVEQKYNLTEFVPLGYGRTDATNITPKILYITDYKYGAGVRVSPVKNKQLMLYALGALRAAEKANKDYKPVKVVISIFQPRAGGFSSWEITPNALKAWAVSHVVPMAVLAIGGQGDFVAGSHCQFCKARTVCAAYYERFADLLDIHDARVMTPEMVATVIEKSELLSSWVEKVKEEAIRQMERGKKYPGVKLVKGRGRRSFKNENDAVDVLLGEGYESDDIFKSDIKGITDIEKLLGKKRFNVLFKELIINQSGRPQIASEDDDRPAIGASAADDYDDLS